jgi:Flp pilus assembly protein TadG
MRSTRFTGEESEQGAVLVLVALFVPVLVAFLIFVIDVNNWMEHQRHLQVQADASAFAAAQQYQPCNNAKIYAAAGQYAGVGSVTTAAGGTVTSNSPSYNTQVGGTSSANIHVLVNSKTFYSQASTSSPHTPDDTTASDPCNPPAGQIPMVDVKATETNLPWYFKALSSVPYINAEARVSILQQTIANNVEALAVANTVPVAARAYVVDEANNDAIVASTPLTDLGPNGQGQDVWANACPNAVIPMSCPSGATPAGPLAVTVNKPNLGVVIALSGNPSDTACGDSYVECFDESSATGPSLLHIQGWSAGGTPSLTAPLARSVTLSTPQGSTCTDGYFSNSTTTCTETISAWVDYGSKKTTGVTVKPVVGVGQATGTTEGGLTPGATSGTAVQWTGTVSLTGAGSNSIKLQVTCAKGAGAACGNTTSTSGTTSVAQRTYAAGASSGSINGAWISEASGATQDANSFEVCETQDQNNCTHNLVFTVDVGGSLADAQTYSDPLYTMRVGTSQANVVACGGNTNPSGSQYRQNLGQGCNGPFMVNTSDPTCQNAASAPYDCIKFVNGVKEGPLQQGMSDRIVNSPPNGDHYYCGNNWTNNNQGGVPVLPHDDSRIVEVFIIPYGTLDASGNPLLSSGYVPIQNFAAFYVTGADGVGCVSDPATQNAMVVGHFIKYIDTLGGGKGSGGCVPSSLGTCVAVLTK